MYSLSRYSCTFPPSELTRCVCRKLPCRCCQRCCCRESVSLAGSSFSCLFMSNSWELENPLDRAQRIYQTGSDRSVAAFLSEADLQRRMNPESVATCSEVLHMCLTSVRKKKKEFHNSQADFISLRFATCISWEVIKDNCRHLWWSHITFVFKSFTEKPVSYTMQGITLGRNLCPFYLNLTPLEVEQGFSFVASRVFSSVFGEVGWFQQGQVV